MKARDVVLAMLAIGVIAFAVWQYKPAIVPGGISDGTISFTLAPDFALATTSEQVTVRSYIPSCDQDFNYCLYYIGKDYQGTNFESAGIRIKKMSATTTADCFTPPQGGLHTSTHQGADYTMTVFSPLSNGAAGHYATGALYRLAYKNACYEFEARIGETQFANYPPGAIQQFTQQDGVAMQAKLIAALARITLPSGEKPLSTQ